MDIPDPGIKVGSPALQANSLPAEPQGKSKNTRVGSLSLLQQIFRTQEPAGSPALQADSLPTELSGEPWQQFRAKVVTAYAELSKGNIGEFTLK